MGARIGPGSSSGCERRCWRAARSRRPISELIPIVDSPAEACRFVVGRERERHARHEHAAREVSRRVYAPERFSRGPKDEAATTREKRPTQRRAREARERRKRADSGVARRRWRGLPGRRQPTFGRMRSVVLVSCVSARRALPAAIRRIPSARITDRPGDRRAAADRSRVPRRMIRRRRVACRADAHVRRARCVIRRSRSASRAIPRWS